MDQTVLGKLCDLRLRILDRPPNHWEVIDGSKEAEAERAKAFADKLRKKISDEAKELGLEDAWQPGDCKIATPISYRRYSLSGPDGPDAPVERYGAVFKNHAEWLYYKDIIIDRCKDVFDVIESLEDDFYRLRWSPGRFLEIGGGKSAQSRFIEGEHGHMPEEWEPFEPIWINEPKVRDAYWRSARSNTGWNHTPLPPWEGEWELDVDRYYCSLLDGTYDEIAGSERKTGPAPLWIARNFAASAMVDGVPGEEPSAPFWKRLTDSTEPWDEEKYDNKGHEKKKPETESADEASSVEKTGLTTPVQDTESNPISVDGISRPKDPVDGLSGMGSRVTHWVRRAQQGPRRLNLRV
jgi:hypothetical protein